MKKRPAAGPRAQFGALISSDLSYAFRFVKGKVEMERQDIAFASGRSFNP
jgi:hypothetical protein